MNRTLHVRHSARGQVVAALRGACEQFPNLQPAVFEPRDLSPRDRALALAIHRTTLQRWLTLAHLLNRHLRQPLSDMEPMLQAVLLSGATQLVLMDRLPAHAVVDESVRLARQMVRSGAGALVNAVLRRVSEDVAGIHWQEQGGFELGRDRLPVEGGYVQLAGPCLPPVGARITHLEAAMSVPATLLRHWQQTLGDERMYDLAWHAMRVPPTTVAVEQDFAEDERCEAHEQNGFVVWKGDREGLRLFLQGHPHRRVQDPASARAVEATRHLTVTCAIDYCAGRGTKTRQLAAVHPQARIVATDVDGARFSDLAAAFSKHDRVRIVKADDLPAACGEAGAELLLLDVPCSNTAVLARRPEARYRWSLGDQAELVQLQRRIMMRALPLLKKGHVLYSTCSLDAMENEEQARWLEKLIGGRIVAEEQIWPSGRGVTYRDGSYFALIER